MSEFTCTFGADPIHTCAVPFSSVVESAQNYYWSARYEVECHAMGQPGRGHGSMFLAKRWPCENRYLHAAGALVMIVEREREWCHAVSEEVMEMYRESLNSLARWGRTEWENVPLPFGNN